LPIAILVAWLAASWIESYARNAPLPAAISLTPQPLTGQATVIDGDGVELSGQEVRFNGVDAPEATQTCKAYGKTYRCGREAAQELDTFLAGSRPLHCVFVTRDRYNRYVADCYRADGQSVAVWLVRNGYAMDFTRYSGGRYAKLEEKARSTKRGLWRGTFDRPWEVRDRTRAIDMPARPVRPAVPNSGPVAAPIQQLLSSSPCDIKGNIADNGARIFHVPGQKFYGKTRISESKGERWFCSEAEARKAGWRKSRV
jgi:endonuclease YncB( thermonuclease family)